MKRGGKMDLLKYAVNLDEEKIVRLDESYFYKIFTDIQCWLNENRVSSDIRSYFNNNLMFDVIDKRDEKFREKEGCPFELQYSEEFLYLVDKALGKEIKKGLQFSDLRFFDLLSDIWKDFNFLLSLQTSDDKDLIKMIYQKCKSLNQRLQSRMGMYEFEDKFNEVSLHLFIFEFRNFVFDKNVLSEADYNLSRSSSPDLAFMKLVCDVALNQNGHLNSKKTVVKFLSYLNESMPLDYLCELSNIAYRSFKKFVNPDLKEIVDHLSFVLDIKNLPLMKEAFFSIFPRCHEIPSEFLTNYYKIFESFSSREVTTDNCKDLLYEIYSKLSNVVIGEPKTGTYCTFYGFLRFITSLFTKFGLRDEVFKSTDSQSILDYICSLSFVFNTIKNLFLDISDICGLNNFDAATISERAYELIENRLYSYTANQVFGEINQILADDSTKEKALNNFFETGIAYGNSDPDISRLQSRPQINDVHDIFMAINQNNKICENILSSEISLLKLSHSSVVVPSFDYTNYVVGYIKSVERYLKEVLAQYFPNNIHFTDKKGTVSKIRLLFDTINQNDLARQNNLTAEDLSKQRKPNNTQNPQAYSTTLECGTAFYSLKYALRNYQVPFLSNQNRIYNLLFNNNVRDSNGCYMNLNNTWIQKVRNGYLHIDIVDSVQKAMEIRKKTSFWLGYTIYILKDFTLKR